MFGDPIKNIFHIDLGEGMKVADLGAGSGFYLKALSERVGNSGMVYAVEIQKSLVKKIEDDLKKNNISNVSVVWGDIERHEGTKIASHLLDAVFVSNVLFQLEDKVGLIEEIKRIIKPKGKVLLVDLSSEFSYGTKEAEIENLFINKGFKKIKNIPVSSKQYGIIFEYAGQ